MNLLNIVHADNGSHKTNFLIHTLQLGVRKNTASAALYTQDALVARNAKIFTFSYLHIDDCSTPTWLANPDPTISKGLTKRRRANGPDDGSVGWPVVGGGVVQPVVQDLTKRDGPDDG